MARSRLPLLALAAASLAPVQGQHSGWVANQRNATMCQWQQPRAAVVRDTVYIDGGYLWWTPGMSSGEYGIPTQDGNPLGLVFTLNFSTPFNSSGNFSDVFGTISKAPGGGTANNFAPNYFDGGMLANDHEWFVYGGLLTYTDAFSTPAESDVLGYQASQYGTDKPGFRPGFIKDQLPDDVNRYIAFGGAANAPSENKAWYFGGMVGDDGGEIFVPGAGRDLNPSNYSHTLITLDMGTQQQETWQNITLPDSIKGRANPELVWVPVGDQGILVVLGGVTYPEFAEGSHISTNEAASKAESGDFMSTIDIYDIASETWHQQSTFGGPTARTRGCAVVSSARDFSSQNIYWYGGYDGLDPTAEYDDDVWVLSLPSFIWIKVSSGTAGHGRAGHKCVMPYPDQMFVLGGYTNSPGETLRCLDGGVVEVVNLTTGKWMDSYHPEDYHDYGVPEMIHLMIGGDWAGGATMLTPTPTGWTDPELASVFETPYPTDKLKSYYPYEVAEPASERQVSSGSSFPKWAGIVLGVLLGLLLLLTALGIWCVYRRRKFFKKRAAGTDADGSVETEESGNRIISWIKGQPSEHKAPTVTTEDTPMSPVPRSEQPLPLPPVPAVPQQQLLQPHFEMADTSVAVEMMDTSPRVELSDTGLTPVDVINKHTHLGQQQGQPGAAGSGATGSLNNPSYYSASGISQTDHASEHGSTGISPLATTPAGALPTASSSSVAPPWPTPAPPLHRPDSPSLGESDGRPSITTVERPLTPPQIMASASLVLTTATGHIRGKSVSNTLEEGPVDRAGTPLQAPGLPPPFNMPSSPPQQQQQSPGSPPPGSPSPLRRSVFYENREDMGGKKF